MTTSQNNRTGTAATAAEFGAWISERARAAGYKLDGPRSGGCKALAETSGLSHAAVSRLLAGQSFPAPRFFEPLAKALNVPLGDMLVKGGIVTDEAMKAIQSRN